MYKVSNLIFSVQKYKYVILCCYLYLIRNLWKDDVKFWSYLIRGYITLRKEGQEATRTNNCGCMDS